MTSITGAGFGTGYWYLKNNNNKNYLDLERQLDRQKLQKSLNERPVLSKQELNDLIKKNKPSLNKNQNQ